MTTLERTRNGRPRLRQTNDVLDYWVERIGLVAPEREHFSYSSMICESDSLFHYGHHFELARIIRDKRGRTRIVLLNGDSYEGSGGFGPSTSSRQRDARNAVSRTNVTSLVVPFSALEGAGIDFTSVMPIHTRDDRFTIEEHSSRKRPAELAKMPDPSGATRLQEGWQYSDSGRYEQCTREVPVYMDNPNETVEFGAAHGWTEGGARRDENGVWHWKVRRHWLGDSIFRARCTERRTRKATDEELAQDAAARAWTTEHDRLDRIQREISQKSWKVDDRYGYGGDYRRMTRCLFASEGFRLAAERANEVYYDHGRTIVHANGVRNGRMPITVRRWATFLSSFDYQESRPLYFLCELPYGAKPSTVDEAVEALKPPEVVAALARGLAVIRQGDLFAIPTKLTKRQIRRMAGGREFHKRLRILGTNHSVTEGIVLKGGAVLGRGVMRHEPEGWRPPDHARQSLGSDWHLLVRNTVPRTQ